MVIPDPEIVAYLVRRAQLGDKEAFSRVVRMMMKDITALTYKMTRDRESALDLAQESFIAAWENLDRFRGEASFVTWLYRIAANKALNYLKKQSHRPTASLELLPEGALAEAVGGGNPETQAGVCQMRQDILEFMAELPPRQRLAFDLRFYKQQSFEEIAGIMGQAVGTVKTHYRQAILKLRAFARRKGWRS